jgi:hypothetical protein
VLLLTVDSDHSPALGQPASRPPSDHRLARGPLLPTGDLGHGPFPIRSVPIRNRQQPGEPTNRDDARINAGINARINAGINAGINACIRRRVKDRNGRVDGRVNDTPRGVRP